MRQMVERLTERFSRFITQRDDLALVVRCTDSDSGLVSKILEGLDESSSSELFWLMIDEFKDSISFSDSCVRAFLVKHEAVRLAMKQQGQPPLPPLPPSVSDADALTPVERLRQLIIFSRSLLPTLDGCGVVWAFLPMQISSGPEYAELMSSLWKHEFPFPWCHHVRMIVRDSFPDSIVKPHSENVPRIQECVVDLSPDAIQQALEEEAGDEQANLADRVNCSLILAGIDYSHGHYDRAVQQYDLVHQYASATQNPTLAAIALNGLGEVHRTQGRLDQAGEFLQAAIAPAAQATSPPVPVLFNIYLNLGELRHTQGRWEEAEVFLQGAGEFAYLLHDPEQRLHCWELLGEAQYHQAKTDVGLKTWICGAIVSGKLDKKEKYEKFVQHVHDHYIQTGNEKGFTNVMRQVQELVSSEDQNGAIVLSDRIVLPGRDDGIPR